MKTRKLATNAILAAMCAVLGAFALDFGSLKITLESLPVLLGALLFGPLDGMAVGVIGTLIYQLLKYGITLTTALWILPYALCGILVGWYSKRNEYSLSNKKLALIVFASEFMILLLNTLILYIDSNIYGYYTPVFIYGSLAPRLLICLIKSAAFTAVLPLLTRAAKHALKR